MKRILTPSATFTPSANTLDLSSITGFDIRRLVAVIDLKTGALVYAPIAGSGASAVTNGVLTLQASVVGLSAADPLLVMYDDATGKVAEDASVQAVTAAIQALALDVVNNHADFQTLHADLSTTLHADLQALATKLGSSPAQSSDVAAVVTKLGTPAQTADVAAVATKLGTPAQSADVAAVAAKLGTAPAQTADVQAVTTKLGTPAQTADIQSVVSKLGTSPAQSSDIAAIAAKLNSPAQSADVAAVTAKLGAAPAQTTDIQALGTLLQSLLTTVQNQRAESLWTDDSGAYYVRVDVPGSATPTWMTPAGAASSAPGTGARPAAGATVLTTTDTYRALNTAASGGAYVANDILKHIETLDPKTGAIIGQFWVNVAQNTSPAAAGITMTDLQLLDGQSEGAATLSGQTAGNAILANLQTALTQLHTDITAGNTSLATLHTDTGTTLHTDLTNLLTSLGAPSDPATALSLIGLTKALIARNPALGTAIMVGSTPVTIATDDKMAVAIGGAADAAATADTGTFSLVALAKRSLARWTVLLGVMPASLGQKGSNASFPVTVATDSGVAQDGIDTTAAAQLAGGVGIRGWLSQLTLGVGKQADTPATAPANAWSLIGGLGGLWTYLTTVFGTQADTAATNSTGSFSLFAWIKRLSGNDDTAIAAINTTATREGALPSSLPDAFPAGASGKLGALGFIWAYAKAGAASLASLVALWSAKTATGTLGAANAIVSLSGGPYGAVGFKLVGTTGQAQTVSALGTRDGTTFDVPLSLITEVTGGGSTSGQSLPLSGAGPFFGYVEAAGCIGVALQTSSYTSGSLAATLTGTPTPRSVRVRAPATDPIATRSAAGLGPLTQVPAATTVGTDLRATLAMPANAMLVLFSIPPGGEIDVAILAGQPGAAPFSMPYPNTTPVTLDVPIPLNGMLPFVTYNAPGSVRSNPAPCGFRWI